MANSKLTLQQLLAGNVFKIPDYQRGYAWEQPQIKDFIDDIDDLVKAQGPCA